MAKGKGPIGLRSGLWDEAPGDDLLLHGLSHTTIGAGAFHVRVRDGIGWDHTAMVARKKGVEVARCAVLLCDRSESLWRDVSVRVEG